MPVMKYFKLKSSKIRVYGKQGKLLPKGMVEEHTAFLHSLLTNDIKGMKESSLTYNLWLKQNGFPVGEFYVYKVDNEYILDTPLPAQEVLEEFNRLKLSMRVYFETLDMEHVYIFGEGSRDFIKELLGFELEEKQVVKKENLIVARNSIRLREEGYDLMGDLSALELKAQELSEEDVEHLRIQRLIPKLGKELREGFSPLEACTLSYAISLTKGCYVGQEAIARVYYRGRLPRLLVLLEGESLKEGQRLSDGNKEVGIITSVSPKGKFALGYVLRVRLEEELKTEEGQRVKVLKTCE